MRTDLLLSVITVTYNDRVALEATLESCRMQQANFADCEFIVVDGNSTDATDRLVEGFADIVSIFVSEPDRGIYDAMNKGLQLASGRYVMYLNAGDVWTDESALESVRRALRSIRPKWLVCGALSLDGGRKPRQIDNIPHSWLRHAYGIQPHCHQSTFVKRDLLSAIGGFSEQYDFAGDFDLILRIGMIGEPAYLERIVVTYAGGGVSAIHGSRIPGLQHRVRCDRMQLGDTARRLDTAYMRYQLFRRRLSPTVARVKRLARMVARSTHPKS